jgi:hypothetical protein
MYGNLGSDSILMRMGDSFEKIEKADLTESREELVRELYDQIYRLLDLATRYGFDDNLWQCYIAYILATNENPFSIICETVGASEDGTVNKIVRQDMECFYHLYHYDFSRIENELSIQCFSILTNYHSMAKAENTYNKSVSEKVRELAKQLQQAENADDMFDMVTSFYKRYGVGKFGLNKAFRVVHKGDEMQLSPITHTSDVTFSHLVGYEQQKQQLIDNTEAFVEGRKANNCLLYGDSGTGKSTCIKAVLNRYYDKGLRLIEVYKHQFQDLSEIIEQVKNRNYKFIIYMDDLSFEEFEIEYKYLKAVIEGGLEVKPDNVLIYATSNRRHLIRETWSDRSDMSADELHRSDTMQEKLSLVARFGVSINFSRPDKKEFEKIVLALAEESPEITLSPEELLMQANAWSIRNGGYSGRVAEQFITHLKSISK